VYLRALAIREKRLGPNHPQIEVSRKAYAAFLRLRERDESAPVLDTDDKPSTEESYE